MKSGQLLILLAFGLPACAQSSGGLRLGPGSQIKHVLDSLLVRDQLFRTAIFDPSHSNTKYRDSLAAAYNLPANKVEEGLNALMTATDSTNLNQVRVIIGRYGYPGKTLVGAPTNEAAFFVIQHSERIRQYLPLIRRAAEQGELPFRLYAMMLDRQLMQAQQPQLYGTQGYGFMSPNTLTGKAEPRVFIWPIQDPTHVNARRRQAGIDLTVEENAARLGIPFQVLTLADVQRMPGYKPAK